MIRFRHIHQCFRCGIKIDPNKLNGMYFITPFNSDGKKFWRIGLCPGCGVHIRFEEKIKNNSSRKLRPEGQGEEK